VIIDTSTLSPRAVRGFAEQAKARGVFYLDAPVSGGPAGAAAGSMAMMVGGDAAALERATPILQHLTARLLHIGPSGAGQVAKLVNNLLVASHLVTAGEALRLGAAAGVSPEALLPVLNGASGRSAVTEVNWPRWIIPGSFDSGFSAGLMRKDVGLALELARELDVTLEATGRAAALWHEMRAAVPDAADFNRLSAALFAGAKP
jgi:3-hydroxyisobutyrate dehydrogenase